MKKVLERNNGAGSRNANEPRLLGSIVSEMLHGNEPLAKGFRQYIASKENGEGEADGWHANTDLGCELKTLLRSDKRMKTGKEYRGVLRCDAEAVIDDFVCRDPHYTFTEAVIKPSASRRSVHLFIGRHITLTRRADGSLHLNFKNLPTGAGFTVDGYAIEVCNEIRRALTGLVEEG